MLRHELGKWRKTVGIALSRELSFKLDFVLKVVAPSFVLVAINYHVWLAIYLYSARSEINGFSLEQMLRYQGWTLIVALLARSHRSWNLSEDIRGGRISAFMLYPFEFWKYYLCQFIAFQGIQLTIASLTLIALYSFGFFPTLSLPQMMLGLFFSLSVGFLWYLLEYLCGLMSFWLEESWVFRYVLGLFAVFLSGALIPLEFFPLSMQRLIEYTPFPYLTSVPVHVFMGSFQGDMLQSFCILLLWIAITALAAAWTWRRGIRLYTAAGM
jgi:ABC-2 type transport system permease protein